MALGPRDVRKNGGPSLNHFAALRGIALAASIAVLALGAAAPAANGAVLLNASETAIGRARTTAPSARIVAPCSDRAYSLFGARWAHAVHWSFNASTVPAALDVAVVEAVIRRSYSNITKAHNDCGRPDKVGAKQVYDGRTRRSANISRYASCTSGDGRNVVSFGRLPRGVLAVTCTDISRGRILEADIRINSRYSWAVSVARCSDQELLEPTVTHEVGHVYGLGHVGERRHPLLTMSTASDGWCDDAASTLGLGDMLGLEALY